MHLGQMVLKIYKNTLYFNSTSIFTQSLEEFLFSSKNVFQQPPQYSEKSGI